MQEKRYLSPAEVAQILDVSGSTVLRLIHDGRLPAVRVSERIYRIPAPAFERFQRGETPPAIEVAERSVDALQPLGQGEKRPRQRRLATSSR